MCTVITDTTQYLDFPSCHASNTKRNISFNLGRRNCSIALDPGLHSKRLEELKAYPIKQHYHEILLMLSSINRWTYILRNLGKTKPKENQNPDNKPFAITDNPRNHNILRAANQFSPVLGQLNNMKLSDFINSRWQDSIKSKNAFIFMRKGAETLDVEHLFIWKRGTKPP